MKTFKPATMKVIIISGLISVGFLFSCSQKQDDKMARLEELKAQKEKISQEIVKLEEELKAEGIIKPDVKTVLVKTKSIEQKTFRHYIEVQGNVVSDNNIFIPAQSMGLVKKIYVKEGDRVTKGQLLAEVDGSILEKSIEQMETAYELAKEVYERQSRLWDKKIGSEIQYLQAKNNKESLEKQLEALKEQYKLSKIYSPINGTVDEISLKVGESSALGGIRVIQLSKLKVEAELSEAYINDVKTGDTVEIDFPAIGLSIKEEVNAVSKVIDAANRTFDIEILIADELKGVMPNMLTKVKITDYQKENAIAIPVNALKKNEKESFVFVAIKDNDQWLATKKPVKTGREQSNEIEILSGLKQGDKLITTGLQNISEGQLIKM